MSAGSFKLPIGGGACADGTVTMNSAPFATVASGGLLDVPITSTDGTPVGLDLGGLVQIDDSGVITSDGITTVTTIQATQNYNLPQSIIKYRDTANVPQTLAPSNTEFDAVNLNPATEIPRRELFDDTPTPLGLYVTAADLVNDTVPQVPAAASCTRAITAIWAADNDTTTPVVMPAEYQGITYAFVSQVGTNGTITISVDGGTTYAAPPFTVGVLGVSFRRTTFTAAGSALYE